MLEYIMKSQFVPLLFRAVYVWGLKRDYVAAELLMLLQNLEILEKPINW